MIAAGQVAASQDAPTLTRHTRKYLTGSSLERSCATFLQQWTHGTRGCGQPIGRPHANRAVVMPPGSQDVRRRRPTTLHALHSRALVAHDADVGCRMTGRGTRRHGAWNRECRRTRAIDAGFRAHESGGRSSMRDAPRSSKYNAVASVERWRPAGPPDRGHGADHVQR